MSNDETNASFLPGAPGSGGLIRDVRSTSKEPRVIETEQSGGPGVRHRDVITSQSKTRERVQDLAEVYTHEREIDAMLNLVPGMFPSADRLGDIGRTFLEPACGAGNFLVAILDRKLSHVTFGTHYRSVATFETAVLTALSSVYGIDIDQENVGQARGFLKADVAHHMKLQPATVPVTDGFWSAVDAILGTNIIRGDTLADTQKIRLAEYHWQRKAGYVIRAWSYLKEPDSQLDLFAEADPGPGRDEVAIHYSLLADNPEPVTASRTRTGVAK